jgi:integrase
MSEPAEFWINLLPQKGADKSPATKRHNYCKLLLDILAEKHPALYAGGVGATLAMEEAQSLVDVLQKNSPGHIFKHRVSLLIRGLERGTLELGWNVAIPEPPLVIPREKPRFTHESFAALPEVYVVKSAFIENLKLSPPDTYTARVGQLLLSSSLFGGLVKKRWLSPWVEALRTSIVCDASQLWMNMVYSSAPLERELKSKRKSGEIPISRKITPDHSTIKEPWEIHRRWFADPLTHALILRWRRDFPEDLNSGRDVSPLLAIRQYFDMIQVNQKKTSDSFVVSMISGCATRIGMGIPPFLLAYAEGVNKSVSLSPEAWGRLVTGKCIITPRKGLKEVDGVVPIAKPLAIQVPCKLAPMIHQKKMLGDVLGIILPPTTTRKRKASESMEALQVYHEQNHEKMCQSLSCLILWCIDLLTSYNQNELIRGRKKSSIRASSVYNYLCAIGKRLISVANNEEILGLESDELHDLYREVIDVCPTVKSRNKAAQRLHGFNQFLSVRLGAPIVDFSDLGFNSGPAELGVNANLISFASFDKIKKVLCPNYSKASRLRKMVLLLAIIAFRCGLREMEVLKLRITDIQGTTEPEILVRTNRYAYNKSSESVRRIPLAHLLEEDELMMLLDWCRDRELEDGSRIPQSLLFCFSGQSTVLLPKHEMIPPVVQAIRQVTGDANLVFHHFRHSFATWLLLRLLKNFPPEIRQRFHFLKHHLFDSSICDKLRVSLLGNQMLGRQALFATAQLCGHAGPEVTLLHYFHLCDWLLGIELAAHDNQPDLDVSTIKAITKLPQHILYFEHYKHRDTPWHMSLVLERLPIPDGLKCQYKLEKIDTRSIPEKVSAHPDLKIPLWRRVFSVIRERQIGQLSFDVLATRSGFSEDKIKAWCSNAQLLAAMKTKRGKSRHVNGVTYKGNPAFNFPQILRLKEDRVIADIVLTSFASSRGRKKTAIIESVREFISTYSVIDGGFSCLTPRLVKKQIQFITSLNVPINQVLVHKIQPKSSKISIAAEQNKLAGILGVPKSSVAVRGLYNGETSRTGIYYVQVKNAHVDGGCKLKANYGFRYAMYMIAIMEGLE